MKWYQINNIEQIDSPALVIYRERVAENIRLLKSLVNDNVELLRPHVKTNKIAEVCTLMMQAGITKFKCATIAEAEMLALIGAPDILLAYQPVAPKSGRFIQLVIGYPNSKFSCLVDNIYSAEQLSNIADANNLSLNVFMDINTGMNRTGIHPSKALLLFEAIQMLPSINLAGLHGYDGHVHETDINLRQQQADAAYSKLEILAEAIETVGQRKMIIVAGGSPGFPIHAKRKNIECSPGTFIFWDWGYKHSFPDMPFDYAALVISRVISISENTITTDLGHKSVAAEMPLPRVHFLNAPDTIAISHSEEHLVLAVPDTSIYSTGDVLYGVPVHICPTVALYEKATVIEHNEAVAEWEVIARKRKINI